jgi:hypothetical protein
LPAALSASAAWGRAEIVSDAWFVVTVVVLVVVARVDVSVVRDLHFNGFQSFRSLHLLKGHNFELQRFGTKHQRLPGHSAAMQEAFCDFPFGWPAHRK